MSYIPQKNCVPATKTGACTQTFKFDYKGEDYRVTYDANVNGTRFLGIPEIKYQKGIGFPILLSPKQQGQPDGEYERLTKTPEFLSAWANEISAFKGQIQKDGRTAQAEKALQTQAQKDTWSRSNAGTGYNRPNSNPGNPPVNSITPKPSGPIELPEVIEKLQDTADATIQSLFDLSDPKDANQIISYPTDAYYENSQDCVYIEQFEYRAPQAGSFTQNGQLNPPGLLQSIRTGLQRGSNLKRVIGAVRLPIPNQLAISNGVSWADDRANALEAGAFFTALGAAQNLTGGNIPDLLKNMAAGTIDLANFIGGGSLSNNTTAGLLLSSFISQYALGKIGINVDPGQFIARATGTTINPNLELLFNGPKLRNFSFAFEFAPNDDRDAIASRRIMRFFRQGMAPKKNRDDLIFIGSPNVFRITYKNGDRRIKGLNAFKICALTACEVNFTPEGVYQSYDDERAVSQPVRTTMTLSFTELTPIFESDYINERDPNKIDPSVLDALGGIAGDEFSRDDIGF
jgi:hypothetical protein